MEEQLYYKLRQDKDGEVTVEGYAYGPEWVAMAMYMDDLIFDTPAYAVFKKYESGLQQISPWYVMFGSAQKYMRKMARLASW
mgnify:CR=1 FL=1